MVKYAKSHQLLEPLVEIALAAGERTLEIYNSDFHATFKVDSSPVTQADLASEAIITSRLQATFPGTPIVAEEAISAGHVPEVNFRFFLVDPLDGSKEFIAKNGEFTVNIALIENSRPLAGVVYAPAIGRIWWGLKGDGSARAKVLDGGVEDVEPITVRSASSNLCAVSSRSHCGGEDQLHLSSYQITEHRKAGSSLKFCLVASGEADVYPRFGRTMEWDTAAGDAILTAAGGSVVTLDRSLLLYGKRDQPTETNFANPHFVAFGDVRLVDEFNTG